MDLEPNCSRPLSFPSPRLRLSLRCLSLPLQTHCSWQNPLPHSMQNIISVVSLFTMMGRNHATISWKNRDHLKRIRHVPIYVHYNFYNRHGQYQWMNLLHSVLTSIINSICLQYVTMDLKYMLSWTDKSKMICTLTVLPDRTINITTRDNK